MASARAHHSRAKYARLLALAALCLLAQRGRAVAEPEQAHPAPLTLPIDVDPCVPIDVAAFQRQLAIELEAAPQANNLARAEASARVALGCSAEQISVLVTDSAARKTWRRRVDLRGVDPRAHTRLLAHSVAELLLASWLELHIDAEAARKQRELARRPELPAPDAPEAAARGSAPAKSPPSAPVSEDAGSQPISPPVAALEPTPRRPAPAAARPEIPPANVQPTPDHEHRPRAALQLGAAVHALSFSSASALIPGGELYVGVPLLAAWFLRVAAQGGHGNLRGELLDGLTRTQTTLRITTASLALWLAWLARTGDLELSVGAGVRLGLLHLAGAPTSAAVEPARSFAPWIGPLISPGLSYYLSARLRATLGLEAGYLAVSVRALALTTNDAVAVSELHGPWLLLRLGLDVAL